MFDYYSNFLKLVVVKYFIIRKQIQEKTRKEKPVLSTVEKLTGFQWKKNLQASQRNIDTSLYY